MQHIECRLNGNCDGLNSSQIALNINAVRTASGVCSFMDYYFSRIGDLFEYELIREDWTNRTYIEYFKNFLDPTLINLQSICLSGHKNIKLRESLASSGGGFCFTINDRDSIFNEKK